MSNPSSDLPCTSVKQLEGLKALKFMQRKEESSFRQSLQQKQQQQDISSSVSRNNRNQSIAQKKDKHQPRILAVAEGDLPFVLSTSLSYIAAAPNGNINDMIGSGAMRSTSGRLRFGGPDCGAQSNTTPESMNSVHSAGRYHDTSAQEVYGGGDDRSDDDRKSSHGGGGEKNNRSGRQQVQQQQRFFPSSGTARQPTLPNRGRSSRGGGRGRNFDTGSGGLSFGSHLSRMEGGLPFSTTAAVGSSAQGNSKRPRDNADENDDDEFEDFDGDDLREDDPDGTERYDKL